MNAKAAIFATLILSFSPSASSAGESTEILKTCVLGKVSKSDKVIFVRWAVVAFFRSPVVSDLASTTLAQREALSRRSAFLIQRLITVDCRKETIAALKADGESALSDSFEALGEAAMEGLADDPNVSQELNKTVSMLDASEINKLSKESGVSIVLGAGE